MFESDFPPQINTAISPAFEAESLDSVLSSATSSLILDLQPLPQVVPEVMGVIAGFPCGSQ